MRQGEVWSEDKEKTRAAKHNGKNTVCFRLWPWDLSLFPSLLFCETASLLYLMLKI